MDISFVKLKMHVLVILRFGEADISKCLGPTGQPVNSKSRRDLVSKNKVNSA